MLFWFGGQLYRWRKVVLLLAIVILAISAWYGSSVFDTLQGTGMTDPNSEAQRAETLINAHFPKQSTDIVLLLSSPSLRATEPAYKDAAIKLLDTLKGRAEVATLTTYYSTQSASMLSRDGHETLVLIQLAGVSAGHDAQFDRLQPLFKAAPLHIDVGGALLSDRQFNQQLGQDLEQSELVALPIVALLLIIIFGGLVAAALPLLVGGFVIAGAFAIVRGMASVMNVSSFATNVITIIGLGLAIDYSLFIITRFREELANEQSDARSALQRTMATAGRTILFSGLTVSISLLALLLFPHALLRSVGLAIIAVALVAMLTTLTLLPAILSLLGQRVNALSLQRLFRRRADGKREREHGNWYRLSYGVMRWAIPVSLAAIALLLLLGSPFLHVKFSLPDSSALPAGVSARIVGERIQRDFSNQNTTEIDIVITTRGKVLASDNLTQLDNYVRKVKVLPNVTEVQSLVSLDPRLTLAEYKQLYQHPQANPLIASALPEFANNDTTRIIVQANSDPQASAAQELVGKIRATGVPAGFTVLVGGTTAQEVDQFAGLRAIIPSALAVMIGAIIVLLFLMTGSVLMPLKAVILNVLSLSATFGTLVWIFQDGHLNGFLGLQAVGSLDSTEPVLIFAVAFGLSMDYEVFLLSRIKEQFDRTGDNREAVAQGLQKTGWLITSAALLLAVVIGTFATSKIVLIQEIGLGVALAIIMDATLVRGLLVPAMMSLLGKWNWWAPRPLRWLWQRIGLNESSLPAVESESAANKLAEDEGELVSSSSV